MEIISQTIRLIYFSMFFLIMVNLKIPELTDNPTINLALDTIKKKKQALIFANTKRSAEKAAEDIANKIKGKELIELAKKALHSLARPTKQCKRLANCIKAGVAFHHAGLTQKQRELIEDNFRIGLIKIICATPTLAAGVDLPAFRTILKDLRRYTHRGLTYIPVLEYLQMAGRAGRPKYDTYGEAITISSSEKEKNKIYEKYILGEPEEILSKLAAETALRMYTLSLIASEFATSKEDLFNFYKKTFWAHQYKDTKEIELKIEKMLKLLEDWNFIKSEKSEDFVSASEISKEDHKITTLGKRVAELYLDPLTAHKLINGIKRAKEKMLTEFSFLQLVSHTLEIRPLLKTRVKEIENIEEQLVKHQSSLLELEPSYFELEYPEFINAIKTALFLLDWINEKDEEFLLEEYNIRPGEIRVKINITIWLLYACEELARILKFQKILKHISKIRFRVKNGVKEELIPLLKLEQVGRVRARSLFRNNIKDIADVKKADLMKLVQILGKNTALKVKEQVGQDFSKVKIKENKRKGQISLKDY